MLKWGVSRMRKLVVFTEALTIARSKAFENTGDGIGAER